MQEENIRFIILVSSLTHSAAPKGRVPLAPRSGSGILSTRTVGPSWTFVISWGVIKIYCFLSEVLAVSIIIFILIRRLMASMNTSNSSEARWAGVAGYFKDNLPRQRKGHPIHSHKERSKQIVEKDFSPPLSERGSFSREFLWVCAWSSVCTYRHWRLRYQSWTWERNVQLTRMSKVPLSWLNKILP